jgi:hypothetical protein
MKHVLRIVAVSSFAILPVAAAAEQASPWERVDALAAGTPITLTLTSGERRTARFRAATADALTIEVASRDALSPGREEAVAKSAIARIVANDPIPHGAQAGAWIGAGAIASFYQVTATACGVGCENDMPSGAVLAIAGMGAGAGAAVGWLVDRTAGDGDVLFPPPTSFSRPPDSDRFFPPAARVRIGPVAHQMRMKSAEVTGSPVAPGLAVSVRLSRHLSGHVEYTRPTGAFPGVPGLIQEEVLRNLVAASSRSAGWSRGIESRRVKWTFSELAGVSLRPWGRVRVELLGGFGIQARENRDYYDAWTDRTAGTSERLFGKYYVLNFESPEVGLVLGADAEVALARRLSVVPTLRYHRVGNPGPTLSYGAGLQMRF